MLVWGFQHRQSLQFIKTNTIRELHSHLAEINFGALVAKIKLQMRRNLQAGVASCGKKYEHTKKLLEQSDGGLYEAKDVEKAG